MIRKSSGKERFDWLFPICILGAALILCGLPLLPDADLAGLFSLLTVAIVALSLLITAICIKGRRLVLLSTLLVCCTLFWVLYQRYYDYRTAGRWMTESRSYKRKVLAQLVTETGEFKHTEWDGWGFAGENTTIYLVFDPDNSLQAAARSHARGKFTGIPCEVYRVHRLESQWYTVSYYTETTWGQCTP